MPYSGADDPDLPSNVQDLADDDREQWVEVFNSALANCQDEGLSEVADDPDDFEDCEAFAFANAWGVINRTLTRGKEKLMNPLQRLGQFVLDALKRAFSEGELNQDELMGLLNERALSTSSIWTQIYKQAEEVNYYAWINDIYRDDDGTMFAIISSEGKLYRADITFEDSEATLGEWTEVVPEFRPVGRSTLKLRQLEDGSYRIFIVTETAALLRVGEIDSRTLFDNMARRAQESGDFPYLTFYHLGEVFRMGQAVLLGRDDNVYVGVYDLEDPEENSVVRAFISSYEADPDYWGASNGFDPIARTMLEIADDIEIPVYTDGIHEETSIVAETDAASWFTGVLVSNKEVIRMNKRLQEAIEKLAGEDEELAEEFVAMVDETNVRIRDKGMITRAGDPDPEPDPEPATPPEPSADADPDADPEADPDAEPLGNFVLDEAGMKELASVMVKDEGFKAALAPLQATLNELSETVAQLGRDIGAAVSAQNKNNRKIEARLELIEKDDAQKQKEWLADLPANARRQVNVTFRPREKRLTDADETPSLQEIADETLAAIEGQPVRRK